MCIFYADVFIDDRSIQFDLGLHLNQYIVYVSSEGSGESAHKRRLA